MLKLPISLALNLQNLKQQLSPYTNKAYLVGGCVRDMLSNHEVKDLDIEVYDILPKDFEIIMKSLNAKGFGKSFFVYQINDIDISLPRIDEKVSIGYKGFKTYYCNEEKIASKRRDFTINSMMINIFTNEFLDFWQGEKHLKQKLLKAVCKDAFSADPLRVLRGVSFSARFGYKIEKNTLFLMQKPNLKELSFQRIFLELEKIFNSNFQIYALYYFYKLNLFYRIFNQKVDEKTFFKTALILNKMLKNSNNKKFIFLYVCINELNLDKEILKNFSNEYKILLHETYNKTPDNFSLYKIALKKPLKQWLGISYKNLKQRAINLKIYENIFNSKINPKDLQNEGYYGKSLGEELQKRKILKIKELLKLN